MSFTRKIIPEKTASWYQARLNTIGASEIAVIFSLNPYKSKTELFYEKIGMMPNFGSGNKFSMIGSIIEEPIAQIWSYNDGFDPLSHVENYANRKKVRTCRRMRGMCINPDFSHLSASIDRVIEKGNINLITGEKITEAHTPLEIKSAMTHVLRKYESGVPIMYLLQTHQQMKIVGATYSEIAILDSEKNFHIFPIQYRPEIGDAIIEKSTEFWNVVSEGKSLVAQRNFAIADGNTQLVNEITAEIDRIAPEIEVGEEELYKDFLSERYQEADIPHIVGTPEIYEKGYEIKALDSYIKELKKRVEGKKNEVKEFMGDAQEVIFDNSHDRFTWRKNAKGTRSFFTNFNVDFDEDFLEQESFHLVDYILKNSKTEI